MNIRLTGTPDELIRAVDIVRATELTITSTTLPRRRRHDSRYDVYLDVQLPPGVDATPATVRAAIAAHREPK